jgi:hypothetical protein
MRLWWPMIVLAACGSKSDPEPAVVLVPTVVDKIELPGESARVKGAIDVDKIEFPGESAESAPRVKGVVDDPRMHLTPDEGTLTIDPVIAHAGAEASTIVRVTPASGFHVSTEIPTTLTLAPPAGVTIAKPRFTAGQGQRGDADEFSEQSLSFVVKATAARAGTYAIRGSFNFGVCRRDSCHPKKQPITITVTAS